MNCPMCHGVVTWRDEVKLYECVGCVRRWTRWPPEHPVLVLGWKGMTWDAQNKLAVPLQKGGPHDST